MEENKNNNGERLRTPFETSLTKLINELCLENSSNTPDHILAECMDSIFWAINKLVRDREIFYGDWNEPGHTLNPGLSEGLKTAKQYVVITDNEDGTIDWNTRSLEDARDLLLSGVDYINKKIEENNGKDNSSSIQGEA